MGGDLFVRNGFAKRSLVRFCLTSAFLFCQTSHSKPVVTIPQSGFTVISERFGKMKIKILVKTRMASDAKIKNRKYNRVTNNCAFDQSVCSVVDYLEIFVNGSSFGRPCWLTCGLYDLHSIKLEPKEGGALLFLHSGDGAESEHAVVEFDVCGFKRVLWPDQMNPKGPYTEMVFYRRNYCIGKK
ncbi:MAG: hypothetical protein HONBIEJF_03056 [Fimbriimonadaceae bacterium]|nr:hypothetical protein [Fimbriimonadaceae bacterium]